MRYGLDDPKLTAYALGELEGEERAAVEAQIAESEETRRTVDEIRSAAWVLSEELRKDRDGRTLEELQHAVESVRQERSWWASQGESRRSLSRLILAMAACLVIGGGVIAILLPHPKTVVVEKPIDATQSTLPFVITDMGPLVGNTRGGARATFAGWGRNSADGNTDNPFLSVGQNPLSSFALDVSPASYSTLRRSIAQKQLPAAPSIRIEELVNAFPYHYAPPAGDAAFAANVEVAQCPWNSANRLVRIAIKAREAGPQVRPAANLVLVVDISQSMDSPAKLPLLKQAMRAMAAHLQEGDRVTVVPYGGRAASPLLGRPQMKREDVIAAVDALDAAGNGTPGLLEKLQSGYQMAAQGFIAGGNNRVVLVTDGDLHTGGAKDEDVLRLIDEQARSKVSLSVLAMGLGTAREPLLDKLAAAGHGAYASLDSLATARAALVDQTGGKLVNVANNVVAQVEFNPTRVGSFRLIGYENAGAPPGNGDEPTAAMAIEAGHAVTVLYEVSPTSDVAGQSQSSLKYQSPQPTAAAATGELMTLKLRYRTPDQQPRTMEVAVADPAPADYGKATEDFRFAAAVAELGLLLRDSPHKGDSSFAGVLALADGAKSLDDGAYRSDFVTLVKKAQELKKT